MPKYTPFSTRVKLHTKEYIVSCYKIYLMIPDFIAIYFEQNFIKNNIIKKKVYKWHSRLQF